eukprot:scaffold15108_cov180-Amphora_coffeaeformis.AAC.41
MPYRSTRYSRGTFETRCVPTPRGPEPHDYPELPRVKRRWRSHDTGHETAKYRVHSGNLRRRRVRTTRSELNDIRLCHPTVFAFLIISMA